MLIRKNQNNKNLENFLTEKSKIKKTWRISSPQANFFRGILRRKREICPKNDLRGAQIWAGKSKIIKT